LLIIPALAIIIVSALVVKIAAIALKLTGLNDKTAHFQALSAFTRTGFTTNDSELIMKYDKRRRIIMTLMVLGNAGWIGVVTTLVVSFTKSTAFQIPFQLILLIFGLFIIYKIASHKGWTRKFTKHIEKKLLLRERLEKKRIEEILHLAEGFSIVEINIPEKSKDIGKKLASASLREKGILVLAIERDDGVIPAPKGSDVLKPRDILICYGKLKSFRDIMKIQKSKPL